MNPLLKIWLNGHGLFLIISLTLLTIVGLLAKTKDSTPHLGPPATIIVLIGSVYYIVLIITSIPAMVISILAIEFYKKSKLEIQNSITVIIIIIAFILYGSEATTTCIIFGQPFLELLYDPISQTPIHILVFTTTFIVKKDRIKIYNYYCRFFYTICIW